MIKILDDTIDLSQISLNDNGLGKLEIISGTDTEELNGIYEAEFTCLMTEKYFDQLHVEGLVALPTEKGEQIFRIYYISKPLNKVVTVKCRHITYDLTKTIVQPFEATGSAAAVAGILSNVMTATPFTITTDIANSTSVFQLTQPRAFRQILGGYQGSFLDVFRGEYEWDNLEVKMLASRGADRGVRIAYRKNLTGCKMELDSSAVYTSVMAFVNIDNNVVYGNVYHKITATYPKVLILDASNDYSIDNIPTAADLTTYAQTYATNNDIESPKLTASIEFVPLWQTDEYKEVAPLERVSLGDTVHADVSEMGMTATARVIKTVWNLNTQRYDSLILGSVKSSLASIIQSTVQTARDEAEKATSVVSGQMNEIASLIINGLGLHRTLVPTADGGYKVYLHNHATLADSDVQYYMSANGIMVSTDYGQTWNAGFDAEGNAVLNSLATITLKALEIYGSRIVFGDPDNKYIVADEYQLNGEDVGISFDGSGYVRFQPQESFFVFNKSAEYGNSYNTFSMRKELGTMGPNIEFNNKRSDFRTANVFNMRAETDTNGSDDMQLWNYESSEGWLANRINLKATQSETANLNTNSIEIHNFSRLGNLQKSNSIEMTSETSTKDAVMSIKNYQSNKATGEIILTAQSQGTSEDKLNMITMQTYHNDANANANPTVFMSLDSASDNSSFGLYVKKPDSVLADSSVAGIGVYADLYNDPLGYITMYSDKLYVHGTEDSTKDYDSENLTPFFIQNGYKAIGGGYNLNDLYNVGRYNCPTDQGASTMTNCPTAYGFTLYTYDATGTLTLSSAYRIQEVTDKFGNAYRRFGASNSSGTWTWQPWFSISGYVSATYTYGSNGSSVKAERRGATVTLYCQINTQDLGTMSTWQQKTICTLGDQFKPTMNSSLLFPVIHDSNQNSGGCIIVYNYGTVTYSTRGYTLPGISTSVWVYATCTYVI